MITVDLKTKRAIFDFAKRFLVEKTNIYKRTHPELGNFDLDSYLIPEPDRIPKNFRTLFKGILQSAQNANMKAGVISGAMGTSGSVDPLGDVLFDFDHRKVLRKYDRDHLELFRDIKAKIRFKKAPRGTPKSIWPKYCKTILSTAEFLQQFKSFKEYQRWVNTFKRHPSFSIAFPMILENEIYGIGFALACDFVKESGFEQFGKPDVHIKKIFTAFGLVDDTSTSHQIAKAISKYAEDIGETPYAVDKVFWLIGSGNLYQHKIESKNGKQLKNHNIGSHRDEFIKIIKKKYRL